MVKFAWLPLFQRFFFGLALCCASACADQDARLDIAPFALPNTPANERWFEEPRDVVAVEIDFEDAAPKAVGLSYRRHYWPETKIERKAESEDPIRFGWITQDDLFNGEWQTAAVSVTHHHNKHVTLAFKPLTEEFPKEADYPVCFRRSVAFRVDVAQPDRIAAIRIYTASQPLHTTLRVAFAEGDAGPTGPIRLSAYNATLEDIRPEQGVSLESEAVLPSNEKSRSFTVSVAHLQPAHSYCGDDGLVTFARGDDAFTISMSSVMNEGPIWASDYGMFITRADDPTTLAAYLERNDAASTIAGRVRGHAEQSFAGAYAGQPRPHATPYFVGVALARQRFRVEPNGEVWVYPRDVQWVPGKDTARSHMSGITHFRFGLDDWMIIARHTDPEPANVLNISARRGGLILDEKVFAVPLLTDLRGGSWASDDPMVAMARFILRNDGSEVVTAVLPLTIDQHDNEHERVAPDPLRVQPRGANVSLIYGREGDAGDASFLRCVVETSMTLAPDANGIQLSRRLKPGESCEVVVKIPHIALDADSEVSALTALRYDAAYADCSTYWRKVGEPGAQLHTPIPQLNALYASHFTHVQVSDFTMPDDQHVINTSVGTSVYGNFSNESAMIVHELDERGQHEQAQRRLDLWVKYQGTKPQPGNFTDFNGMYFGAGGFEHGQYNQHHAWVLWAMCEHLLLTGDDAWFRSVADSAIAGADWVFRQRKNTMEALPHSRGWEHGFLPAGSLEDVEDFHYWLSTNALTWRAVESTARALEAIHHADAPRVRTEADAYRADLIKGFNTMRQHTPLARLRDGRWVPDFPSRLYHRGRDVGWIRETLEGSVYLLLSGLYAYDSKEADWILDDFQDNRYTRPPYGYFIPDFENTWFNRGGISMQPNLLAGLMPHLDRDEPEIYIWMFYNAWCACYREEVNAMVEHPFPWLGFSNRVVFKPSDEANACSWLRTMFVYTRGNLLHFGRAIPRTWFVQPEPFEIQGTATPFGPVGIKYTASDNGKILTANVTLGIGNAPGKILVRFRDNVNAPVASVTVNGQPHSAYDANTGDVDITGMTGAVEIVAKY